MKIISTLLLLLLSSSSYSQDIPEFVKVKGGSFDMGSSSGESDESPVHRVTLDDFSMSKYEITNKQYCAFLNERGNKSEGGKKWIDLKSSDINKKTKSFKWN